MARTLDGTAQAKIAQQMGTEPFNYVLIDWTGQGQFVGYADKDVDGIQGKILEISPLDEIIKLEGKGASQTISIKLDDTNGELKNILDNNDIHRKPVAVYQAFQDINLSHAFRIMYGYISSPINWNEGERTLSFDIMSKIFDMEVGFSPEEGQLPFLLPQYNGKPWPLCFGNPIHVPAVLYNETLLGTLNNRIVIPDPTLGIKISKLQYRLAQFQSAWNYYYQLYAEADKIARLPRQIRDDYIKVITTWDDDRNQQETLADQIKELQKNIDQLRELVSQAPTEANRGDLLDTIDARVADRDNLIDELQPILEDMQNLDIQKQRLEIETENAEYAYKIQTDIQAKMAKLKEETWKIERALLDAETTLNTQTRLSSLDKTVSITNGVNFPQGQSVDILINGINFGATFSGDTVTLGRPKATYTGVKVTGPYAIDTFNIEDSTISLKGMYCLLTSGKIIRISDQVGTQCRFELRLNKDIYQLKDTNKQNQPKADSQLDSYTQNS